MQRDLEDDARKLAVVVDQPLGENGRGRLNTEGLRQAVEPIERGDVEGGRERLEGAENELRRLAPTLRERGVLISFGRTNKSRVITIALDASTFQFN